MQEKDLSQNRIKEDTILKILWLGTILVCLKSIFTDFGFDGAYQLAMTYRHLSGDHMLLQMWEPHQTSIFLNDLLVGAYRLIVPSLTGVVLWLQVCGTLLYALLGYAVYRSLRGVTDPFTGQVIWMFLLVFRAKQTVFPEYANMELGFSILAFCLLLFFFRNQEKWYLPMLIGACIFLQTLSYPSCVLSAVAVVVLFFLKTKAKWRNTVLFLGTAAMMGMVWLGYFLIRMGTADFLLAVKNIFLADSHSSTRFDGYWRGFLVMAVAALGCIALAMLCRKLFGPLQRFSLGTVSAGAFLILEIVMLVLERKTQLGWTCSIYFLPVPLLLLSAWGCRKATQEEKTAWQTGVYLSAASFAATLVLTNLGMITITAYLVLGAVVSFLTLRHLFKDDRCVIILLLLLVLVHRGLVIWGMGNMNGRVQMVWEVQNVIRGGPAVGVVCDHLNKEVERINLLEFPQLFQKQDKVLFVGEELINPLIFLYTDAQISNYSTIDTPQYNECLEEYYQLNPDKEPTVVAVSSWFGNATVPEDTWIMQWVNARYELTMDASYFRIYRKLDGQGAQ